MSAVQVFAALEPQLREMQSDQVPDPGWRFISASRALKEIGGPEQAARVRHRDDRDNKGKKMPSIRGDDALAGQDLVHFEHHLPRIQHARLRGELRCPRRARPSDLRLDLFGPEAPRPANPFPVQLTVELCHGRFGVADDPHSHWDDIADPGGVEVAASVRPGPHVTTHTPGFPVTREYPSAIAAAPRSFRATITLIPRLSISTSNSSVSSPVTVNAISTPSFTSASAIAS